MIEHREIRPPILVQTREPYDEIIEDLVDETPPGHILRAGKYTFPLPISHEIGAITVLRNGHGLARLIPEGTDVTHIRNTGATHLKENGDRYVLIDFVAGQPHIRAISHIFTYKPGFSPERARPRQPQKIEQGGPSAS